MAILDVALPALAALVGLCFGHVLPVWHGGNPITRNGGVAAVAVITATAVSTVLAAILAIGQWANPHPVVETLTTIPTGSVPIDVSLRVDQLSAVVALLVCCVSMAVVVYAAAARRDDGRFPSYVSFVALFTAATLLMVLSGDLVILYVAWLLMGGCSYLLLSRDNARHLGKAVVTAGIGSVALGIGIVAIGTCSRTFAIGALPATAPHTVAGALLVIIGVAAASAQFPLHGWLPDASGAGAPLAALIQSATTAAAGVYVVARLFPVFLACRPALVVLAVLAVVSMLAAGLAALAQDDLRRLLAFATISQLAIAFAGLAVGTRSGAILQLLSHGVVMAALILGTGCAGTGLLSRMGGLRLRAPVTFITVTCGLGILAGLPPGSIFFGENVIATAAWRAATGGARGSRIPEGVAWLVLIAVLATIVITAVTAMRAWLLAFFAEPRDPTTRPATGPQQWVAVPLTALAVVAGLVGLTVPSLRPDFGLVIVTALLAAASVGGVFLVWNEDPARDPARRLGRWRLPLEDAFYVDDVATAGVLRAVTASARTVLAADRGLDATLTAGGRAVWTGAEMLAAWAGVVTEAARRLADRTIGPVVRWLQRRFHSGEPRFYLAAAAVLAIVALVLVVLVVL
jgi:NADH-quinone oxidoreductase subunit L